MRSETEISTSKIVLEALGTIWNPGGEALKLRQDLNVRSLEDIAAAAGRAGHEICYVDLPAKVSGFVAVIAGKPYIVVNRTKSPEHQQYTIAHELGHHVLHVNPIQDHNQLGLQIQDMAEFQADMFAATLVFGLTNHNKRDVVLRQNPESLIIPASALFMTLAVVVIALLVHLFSRFFSGQRPGSAERK